MNNTNKIKSAIVAGIIATAAMTAFTFMAPLMGIEMNIPQMLANNMGAPIIVGWLAHFMVGIILALLFVLVFISKTKFTSTIKAGLIFSILPWLLAQIIVMPMMAVMNGGTLMSGLFSGSMMMAMASLVGHLIYGLVLGATYKPAKTS